MLCAKPRSGAITSTDVDFWQVKPLSAQFGISAQAARVGEAVFLIAYAFGSELWAPWSEELGRWPILQASLFFVNSGCWVQLSRTKT